MNLQEQINLATPGSTITISGERCIGNFIIDKELTIEGGPGSAIVAPPGHSGTDWANPAIEIKPMTGPVVLRKLSITVTDTVKNFWDLIRYGGADAASGQTSIDKAPKGLWIDECDIFGRADVGSQRGISANGANFKITKSRVREIHGKGFDTQAVCSWNGPGPFLIEDCYMEAAGENIMFGGSPPIIPGLIHTGITVRRTTCFKPLGWRGVWSVKNLFELKNAKDVLVEGCVFDGCWADAQAGRAIVFTPRPSDSGAAARIEDVQFLNNIVRNTGSGVLLLGHDEPPAPTDIRLKRVRIANNLFEVDGPKFDSNGAFLTVIAGTEDVTVEHNTAFQTGHIVIADYDPNTRFTYRDNITRHNEYGIFGSGKSPGNPSISFYFPGSVITKNLIAKEVNAPSNTSQIYPEGNQFPATMADVGFVDLAGKNYRLASSSPYKGKGTNGSDPGCDIDQLESVLGGGTSPLPEPLPPTDPGVPTQPLPLQPSPDGTKATTIVDSQLAMWTLSPQPEFKTLRDGQWSGGGQGTIYKYANQTVYVLGMDTNWYAWVNNGWRFTGPEPGVPEPPKPIDPPKPVEPPTIPAPPTRKVAWPKTEAGQESTLNLQWLERYRLKTTKVTGDFAIFEKVA